MTVSTDDAVADTRRALGRRLAAARRWIGITQVELARRLAYSRSSVANAEIGRALPERTFWGYADRVLGTGDEFVRAYDAHRELVLAQLRQSCPDPPPAPAPAPPAVSPARPRPAVPPGSPPVAAPPEPVRSDGVHRPAVRGGAPDESGWRGTGGTGPVEAGPVELVWGGYLIPAPDGDHRSPQRPAARVPGG
ncbi:helix-turn-helix domain-containing protein [Polymorphospora lycopeni]|uniref:Helix-turn-helix transcriptional regulator n=1 Tax=Polymorphospora lycopeni TaxID=3140240 RepID=A0ABV5D330_9ACTN